MNLADADPTVPGVSVVSPTVGDWVSAAVVSEFCDAVLSSVVAVVVVGGFGAWVV